MFDIIGKRNYFFAFSIAITIIGLVACFVNGFKFDVQFEGGTIIQIQMNDAKYETSKAEDLIKKTINKTPASVQKLQSYNPEGTTSINKGTVIDILRIQMSKSDHLSSDEFNKLFNAFKEDKSFSVKKDVQPSLDNIDPAIGDEMRNNGLIAIFISSILIILYLWIRFQVMGGLAAGVTAVIALVHDVLITLTVYVLFKIPLNESFIAAGLTIFGYSVCDTIIIYDRIRENANVLRKVSVEELVNKSILQTLKRSINTVVTVLMCILTIYIFASVYSIGPLKEFTLPLIIGITSGCYSSIFIASPLWVLWKNYTAKAKVAKKAARA